MVIWPSCGLEVTGIAFSDEHKAAKAHSQDMLPPQRCVRSAIYPAAMPDMVDRSTPAWSSGQAVDFEWPV